MSQQTGRAQEEAETETQVFSLRQNLKQGCNIAYDGGSSQTFVTEEYAKRKGLKRIGGAAAAFGLGETEATVEDIYMVTICDRNLKVHYLEALAVPYIYTGPAATCPKNLRTRFMRTYTPLPKELHQTGAATDVCIGADYPHLQPKHIEQEMDGPLHVYKVIFDCGFVLRSGTVRPAMPADKPVVAAVEAAAAAGVDPVPAAALEMELEAPGAAPTPVGWRLLRRQRLRRRDPRKRR